MKRDKEWEDTINYQCDFCGNEFQFKTRYFRREYWGNPLYPKTWEKCKKCGHLAHMEKQRAPAVIGTSSTGWPMVSESAGVSPEQVPAMQRQLAEKGVKCSFDSEGRPTFNSPTHRKQCLKAMGLVDKSSYN